MSAYTESLEKNRRIIEQLDAEARLAVAELVNDALEVGIDRPVPELRDYPRYENRERDYQAYLGFAEDLMKRS